MITTHSLLAAADWVAVTEPTAADYHALHDQYQVPTRFLTHIRQKKGRARFDYDYDTKCGLFIFKVLQPDPGRLSEKIHMTPFVVLLSATRLITLVTKPTKELNQQIEAGLAEPPEGEPRPQSLFMAMITLMYAFNDACFDRINDLSNLRERLEKYKTAPSNEQIVRLSELSKSLIYLRAAASGNLVAARQLAEIADSSDYGDLLTKRERYWLHNLQTEFEQARDLAQVHGEIVQQTTDAYANLLDKSLNTTMWIMTIWSLALAIPPIISGFYGMNVKLPIIGGNWDWPFSLALAIVPAALLIWRLQHRRHLSVKDL